MKAALVIMAAGMGSRYGGNKQVDGIGPNGEILMEYSIFDALRAGFTKVVFIIKPDMRDLMENMVGHHLAARKTADGDNVEVCYAYQDFSSVPDFYTVPSDRVKPFGTVHALLCAREFVHEPFVVINADDYYGKEAFVQLHDFLQGYTPDKSGDLAMAGFVLKNTLSDNGGVTRGICKMDEQNNLTEVVETKNIVKTATGAEADSVVVDVNSLVSMNMWGLTPDFLDVLEEGFKEFFEKEVPCNPLKAEYLIPIFIGELLEQGKMSVKVLKTNDTWYGMTYHEDVAAVKDSFKKMLENGVYKADLFSDL